MYPLTSPNSGGKSQSMFDAIQTQAHGLAGRGGFSLRLTKPPRNRQSGPARAKNL